MTGYMGKLLEELGWNSGTRVPLASDNNKKLEDLLITRQDEIQRLKESSTLQRQKQADLDKYIHHVTSESQENTKLLLAQRQQLDQESKAKEESGREASRLEREVVQVARMRSETRERFERTQNSVARMLRRADALKSEVCGERGALTEWRAALDRSADDIDAIYSFTKQDLSKAKELETKRLRVKGEHDRLGERLTQLCSDLAADERSAETLSAQVDEAREERRRVTLMWAGAVDNLRQRDKDIRHTREEYAALEAEAAQLAEQTRERQAFLERQAADNAQAERECARLAERLARQRRDHAERARDNLALHTHVRSMQRVLHNMAAALQELRARSKQNAQEQSRTDAALDALTRKMSELKEQKTQTLDKTKSAQARAKELQDMLNEEEKYASGLTVNQQRSMHCTFSQQQKLLALKSEEKLARIQIKSCRATMGQLDGKQKQVEKDLLLQKENLYTVCYQVETIGARVALMEGAATERDCDSKLAAREARLKEVCALHAARVALLAAHSDKLRDEMRRLARDIAARELQIEQLNGAVKTRTLAMDGEEKASREAGEAFRRARVEESLLKLRAAHAERAVANLDNRAYTLQAQRLQLDAAMSERQVEVGARVEMFSVQKRALAEDCGKLRGDIREREQRIEQLKKRYDIFISSLGKDESGEQLSVTFFKIKFASERAELRARGAALDADIERSERDVSALEATLRVMNAAHDRFLHHVMPLREDEEEIKQLKSLGEEYYALHAALQQLRARAPPLEERVRQLAHAHTLLADKQSQLRAAQADAESEWEAARERLARQQARLENASEVARAHRRRALKLAPDADQWRLFHMELWGRHYAEAAYSGLRALLDACRGAPDVAARVTELATRADLRRRLSRHHRRCHALLQRLLTGEITSEVNLEDEASPSLRSRRSSGAASRASVQHEGYARRLTGLRRTLKAKLGDRSLADEEVELKTTRSSMSMSVVTLGLDTEPVRDLAAMPSTPCYKS